MGLSITQIEEVRSYIVKKGFVHLDVQMEILDHVSSAVEERMTEDPGLSLDEAIRLTHQSFGVMGFSVIESAVIKSLNKKYNRAFWKAFLKMFSFPYILLMSVCCLLIFKLQQQFLGTGIFYIIYIVGIILFSLRLYIFYFSSKKLGQYISYRISGSYMSGIGSFLLLINLLLTTEKEWLGLNDHILLSSIVIQLFIVYLVAGIKTAKSGIEDTKGLMLKHSVIND